MSHTLTRRERLRRCFFNEELDRPGVYIRSGFPADDPSYDTLKAYVAIHTELKRGWWGPAVDPGWPMETRVEPYSTEFRRLVTLLHTPKGDLRRSFLDGLEGQPGLHETYFINSREDAEKYLSLSVPDIRGDVSSFSAALSGIGDAGIVDVGLGMNPGGFVAELCGSENFAMLSVTDRDILHRLCEREMGTTLQRVKLLLAHGVGPFFSMLGEEYIVPPLHGPGDFQDFNVRYDKPIIDLIHEGGGRIHVHCHGPIKAVFSGFTDMGVDVLHPIEPPPQGNMTAREAKALARGRMCLEGNIQINRMYEATPAGIAEETERLIADAFDDRKGLIVCPSASPYIRGRGADAFPRFKAMIDTVLGCRS